MDDDVGDIMVNEELARQQVDDLIGRHPAVGQPIHRAWVTLRRKLGENRRRA
jgi:hypothetical protein